MPSDLIFSHSAVICQQRTQSEAMPGIAAPSIDKHALMSNSAAYGWLADSGLSGPPTLWGQVVMSTAGAVKFAFVGRVPACRVLKVLQVEVQPTRASSTLATPFSGKSSKACSISALSGHNSFSARTVSCRRLGCRFGAEVLTLLPAILITAPGHAQIRHKN